MHEPFRNLPVLIVDADPANGKLLSVMLREAGSETRVARSAEDALVFLLTFRPRLILVDLILPLMSGLLFVQCLKSVPATRGIVIVAVTAFSGPQAQRVALDAGCAAFLQKPIDALSFTQSLSMHLKGSG